MLIVIALTLLAGVLGGFGNLFIGPLPWSQDQSATEKTTVPLWWQMLSCLTLGVIAAALVPLFLSMAKSDLVSATSGTNENVGSNRFVYFGFCLIAAVTSRKFIDSLAARALRLADDAQQRITKIDRNLQEVNEWLEEPDPTVGARTRSLAPMDPKTTVLNSLISHPRFTRRNAFGISQETGLSDSEVQAQLEQLTTEGLVAPKQCTDGRTRWAATQRGRASLN